jgi:hypothetical protein
MLIQSEFALKFIDFQTISKGTGSIINAAPKQVNNFRVSRLNANQ